MTDQVGDQGGAERARLGGAGTAGRCRAASARAGRHGAGGHRQPARQVNDQEAHDFGISTKRVCLEIEHVDADDDVLRHTVTADYSGHPYVTRHRPTPEELAPRE
ncbi:hypothetical protein OOK39_44470 [Streptomyces sp. NBC_00264]|uniref:hypothetical protein n=1 Tax=unclassified Streptomyces TaxID=2593676 RepID=UPI002251127C|nr:MULTISPECIES: hypothetical protein [unclassified Streptomyces]WSG48462.1 hypothetical protein OHA38_00605 [Streptomyces sp. NBC_01732]WSW10387.1 hypothetical protein OG298_42115 [Streptomyces sp. NBC_01005]WSW99111.1 hypothetical protein OG355_00715 [Streptomyces sp. NBC_00987]WTC99893.1 hypothetical protein OH736_42125 [Streptomyces sp. NBC_01650]MCX5165934.1 hypothetical protein [Streptomyces sp. NBC_00305]